MHSLKKTFFSSFIKITLIISISEWLVMMLLPIIEKSSNFSLSASQENLLDVGLLTLISSPFLWFLILRPLSTKIVIAQRESNQQSHLNRQLKQALDAHALVSMTDAQGTITYVNEQFCKISGYETHELLGKNHRVIHSGYHDKTFIENLWKTLKRNQTWKGELCNRNKSGQLYWVDCTIVPLQDNATQEINEFIAICRDISLQKANELKLTTLKQALDSSNEMLLITNQQAEIEYVNPAFCSHTGWKEHQIIGRKPRVLNSNNADSDTLKAMTHNLKEGKSWSGRLLNRRHAPPPFKIQGQTTPPDKMEFWADVNITPIIVKENIVGYVQVQRDVTQQVQQEAHLYQEHTDTIAKLKITEILQNTLPLEERFQQVLEILFDLEGFKLQSKGGVFLSDQENRRLNLFTLNGHFSQEFIEREQRVDFGACLCGRVALSGELLISDDCFCDPRHEHRFENMKNHGHYIVPIKSANEPLGILFLYTDPYPSKHEKRLAMLTQLGELLGLTMLREHAQNSLKIARDAAEQNAKIKTEFLANMSHEIRTPMNGVIGMLDILRETHLDAQQTDLLQTAVNSAESLLVVINDILDFSKLEAGKITLESIEFNLVLLVEEVCTLMSGRAHDKNLELNCFINSMLPHYWRGDPTRIRQVLMNLLGNAVKFTEQGEISVTVKLDDKNHVYFEVTDTGIGIPEDKKNSLFQPFNQADSSTARRFGGTGLGLSISKNLVEIMGGTIGIESVLEQGSCFWFTLPLLQTHQENHLIPVNEIQGKRILIVDDNATNRAILEHYLHHWGCFVSSKDNAKEALLELETQATIKPYDLLISDLHMPEMDGYFLAKSINANPLISSVPKLLLSSGLVESEEKRTQFAFNRSLLKPVRKNQLFEAIVDCLNVTAFDKTEIAKNDITTLDYPNYNNKRLLVVEDNVVNQKVIVSLLKRFNIEPDLAENGEIALRYINAHNYDLVLMDCQMPVLDGYATTEHIREKERKTNSSHLPIIALTAHAAEGEREKCLNAGMDDYLTKPIVRDQLSQMLALFLHNENVQQEKCDESEEKLLKTQKLWDKSATLKRIYNDYDLFADMITLFLEELPKQIEALNNAIMTQDYVALAHSAHTIKGMVGHFSTATLLEKSASIEQMAREKVDLSIITTHAKTLIFLINELANALEQERERLH